MLLPANKMAHPNEEEEMSLVQFIQDSLATWIESFEGIHETGTGVPEEDMFAHGHSFLSLEYDLQFDLPKYRQWVDNKPLDEVYAEHKK